MSQFRRALLVVRLPLSVSASSRLAQALAGSQSGCSSPLVAIASCGSRSLSSYAREALACPSLPLLVSCSAGAALRGHCCWRPGRVWLFVLSLRSVVVLALRCLLGSCCCSGLGRHPGRVREYLCHASCDFQRSCNAVLVWSASCGRLLQVW